MSLSVFEGFLSTPEMLEVFAGPSVVQAMMDFEAALARAQAAEGVISRDAALAIAGVCKAELYDVEAIVAASRRAGSLAIPLVAKLTETVALFNSEASQVVHWGSTSQDVIDTATVLVTRRAMALIDRDLSALIASLLALYERHGHAPLLARTLMQPASVTSFGFKLAGWLAALIGAQQRLHAAAPRALQLQFGGAVGSLATLGEKGPAVARRVAGLLQLPEPQGVWHTQRGDWVSLGCEIGVLVGACAKIATDWALMGQGEIGELAEPSGAGRGGSSAMPHKRNPVSSMVALAAAQRAPQRVAALLSAMAQEHERGLGNWQAELAEWAGLFVSAHGGLKALADAAAGLQVDEARMLVNLGSLRGVVHAEAVAMRMARVVGKPKAQALLEMLSRRALAERVELRTLALQALDDDAVMRAAVPRADIETLFDPHVAAGSAVARADEALARLRPQAQSLAAAQPWALFLSGA
jgi:3-carboxy-cis,cis-muconate cycloisomerase